MFIPNFLLSCIEIKNQLKMNRIFTLFIAVFSVFSIVSCDRSSDETPQEQPRIIGVPFTEEIKGSYIVHYKNNSTGYKESVPANKYKLELREGNIVYWTDENGEHEEFFPDIYDRFPYAGRNSKKLLFYIQKTEYRGSQYVEIGMMRQDANGLNSIFTYYCTKRR